MTKLYLKGFHSTSEHSANNIIEDIFKINTKRKNEWLGYGIYFFKYKSDAQSWGKNTYYCNPNPVIIECEFEIEEDKFLDLDDPEKKNTYEEYFNEILSVLTTNNKSLVFRDKEEAMCFGLNLYKKEYSIDAIQYTFKNSRTKKAMGYKSNEMSYTYNEVQFCITRNDCIINKKIYN